MNNWRRKYYRVLDEARRRFGKRYGIDLDERFDPVRWLRSYSVPEPKVVWHGPRRVDEVANASPYECRTVDIWFDVPSQTKKEIENYKLRFKLQSPRSMRKKIFYPIEYDHVCMDILATGTGSPWGPLFCKHVYRGLKALDDANLPLVARCTFTPNQELLQEFHELDRDRNLSAVTKLEATFALLEDELRLRELPLLRRLNRRLKFLRRR